MNKNKVGIVALGTLLSVLIIGLVLKKDMVQDSLQDHIEGEYVSCGCGCCPNSEPVDACLYKSKGDLMSQKIEEDKKQSDSKQCGLMGCTKGIRYTYCD